MGPYTNTVVLSEKWTTVELTNKSPLKDVLHIVLESHGLAYLMRLYT